MEKAITIRIKSQAGFSRVSIQPSETYKQLKEKISTNLNMNYKDLQLLLNKESGTRIIALDNNQICMISQIFNGVQIWAKGTPLQNQPKKTEDKPTQMQEEKEKEEKEEEEIKPKCNHGPSGKCLNCILPYKDDKATEMKWQCMHGPNGKCTYCLDSNLIQNTKHISFDAYLNKSKQNCKHPVEAKCNNCMPPSELNFKRSLTCPNHIAFKQSMCAKCMPDTCIVKRQIYRHVDYVEFMNYNDIKVFLSHWVSQDYMVQKIGLLYGYFSEDPNYKDGVRAIVEALYEPPQIGDVNGVQLLNDPQIYQVEAIAQSLGLERIGWIYTDITHDAFMDSQYIRQAAQFQQQFMYRSQSGYPVSKFISVVFKTGKTNQHEVVPEVYMVSDQCQALERDNVFAEVSLDTKTCMHKRHSKDSNDMLPSIIYDGKSVESIENDFFLVNIGSGQPKSQEFGIIKHGDFPRENREDQPQNINDLKNYLQKFKNEKTCLKYSDFHLLLYIANVLDVDTSCVIGQAVYNEQDVSPDLDMVIQVVAGLQ